MPILNWLNREQDVRSGHKVPYRLLEEVPEFSAGAVDTSNLVIQGDNLEALKALLPFYAGRVKCVYIDPPYNTRSAFEHYDDNLEHATWLSMMWPRLELLRELLAQDGSIWVSIDDNEAHYLKVLCDEIFGRANFVANVVWQKRTSPEARLLLGTAHDDILVYAKNGPSLALNKLLRSADQAKNFKNPDNDPRGAWASSDFTAQGWRPNQMYKITSPTGVVFDPPPGRCWGNIESAFEKLRAENRIWFGKDGSARPRVKTFLSEQEGVSAWTWWTNSEVGHNQEAKKEIINLFGAESAFDTPKPERLLERILHIATNPGDIVLDSFLGSGTTAAVAHKMGRRYIGIEMGDHAVTHCVPRLRKVIEGESGGISEAVGWTGGGGFRFYRLGPPAFDPAGHIRADIKFPVLAAHVWFSETGKPWRGKGKSPLLGIHNGRAYALLYNGILGDKRPEHGNVLTRATLDIVKEKISKKDPAFRGSIVVYGEMSRLAPSTLERLGIEFKQMPYDVKARA